MPEARQQDATALRDALLNAYTVCIERAKVGRINAEKLSKAKAELNMVQKQLDNTIACFNHTTAIYKNIKQHDAERKEAALSVFNKAIAEVAKIVPDANMRGMHLKVTDSGKVKIVNDKDQDINKREGGAVRTTLGMLMRYICLNEIDNAIKLMLFDESFFTLSDNTTIEVRQRLEQLSKDCCIVVVEQRRNVADGIVDMEYEFVKDEQGCTHVRCTDLRKKENDG